MSTHMDTDEVNYPKLAAIIKRRKTERAAAQLLKDNYNRQAALRARSRAEREAVVEDPKDPTTIDLQDTQTQLEYMRVCLCSI